MSDAVEQMDPIRVAANMVLTRGKEAAIHRCQRYISGEIRSENPQSFWLAVLAAITHTARAEG